MKQTKKQAIKEAVRKCSFKCECRDNLIEEFEKIINNYQFIKDCPISNNMFRRDLKEELNRLHKRLGSKNG